MYPLIGNEPYGVDVRPASNRRKGIALKLDISNSSWSRTSDPDLPDHLLDQSTLAAQSYAMEMMKAVAKADWGWKQ